MMAPKKSPFADPTVLKKITDNLTRLATQSVHIEEGVDKAKREAADIANKFKSDFDILSKIPPFFTELTDNLTKQNTMARDAATKISALFEEFVVTLEVMKTIETKEEVQQFIEDLNNALEVDNPLDGTPLDGFQGVTNEFNYIWNLKIDETKHVIDVLDKASTDIPKTIKQLTAELQPVLRGVTTVQKALKDYAGHIQVIN